MKNLVINYRSFLRYLPLLLLAIFIVCIIGTTGLDALGVISNGRELPIYSVETEGKEISISFDCAWGADDIPNILDTLDQKQVKASFFIVGQWAQKYPDVVRKIVQQGHDIGNHSYSHLRMGELSRDRSMREIQECGKVLDQLTGRKTELFRAPYGDYTDNTVSVAKELGYFSIQWDVDSLDWKPDIGKEEIMNRVINKLTPGSIILFHNDTKHTAQMLPEIIDTIQGAGYDLVPVSQLILREKYYVDFDGRQKKKQ